MLSHRASGCINVSLSRFFLLFLFKSTFVTLKQITNMTYKHPGSTPGLLPRRHVGGLWNLTFNLNPWYTIKLSSFAGRPSGMGKRNPSTWATARHKKATHASEAAYAGVWYTPLRYRDFQWRQAGVQLRWVLITIYRVCVEVSIDVCGTCTQASNH